MLEEKCPQCRSVNVYQDGALWICPECSHEWTKNEAATSIEEAPDTEVRDANGNPLADGDSVIILKDLKIKGASSSIKGGTKVRNIRLLPAPIDGHNFSCKIDGVGSVNLKSELVKKA